jgi:hypothetical protein
MADRLPAEVWSRSFEWFKALGTMKWRFDILNLVLVCKQWKV